jgi:hypothetical protein
MLLYRMSEDVDCLLLRSNVWVYEAAVNWARFAELITMLGAGDFVSMFFILSLHKG